MNNSPNMFTAVWRSYRSEVVKWGHDPFYRVVVLLPFICGVLLATVHLFGTSQMPPGSEAPTRFDIGSTGTYMLATQMLMVQLGGGLLSLVIIAASAWSVGSEYTWKTTKVIALYQPNRPALVIGKALFIVLLNVLCTLSLLVGWLVLGTVLKRFYGLPIAVTPDDATAIGRGFAFAGMWFVSNTVWGMFTLTIAFLTKSAVGGLLAFIVAVNVDNVLHRSGLQQNNPTDVVSQLIELLHPFTFATNLNNLIATDSGIGVSIQAMVLLLLYAAAFIGITLAVFAQRDIVE
jgi:ABC-type transport system involved in multi-copper enzyme maturation permease subunit